MDDNPDIQDYAERYGLSAEAMADWREIVYGCRYRNSTIDMLLPCDHDDCGLNNYNANPDLLRQMKAKAN